jgi:mannose-1-phosphate guanylyltransferase/phosphomannomutase
MKAVILAGGEGTRLRPLSVNCPKPMVSLFEKPVLEHTIKHLKDNGITDIILTLQTLPHVITDYFGNGESFGVAITNVIEKTPLGTAGAVRACLEYLDAQPFVVISGDGVCDFDLNEAFLSHKANMADVTILLSRQKAPRAYGLVMTDMSGRVTRFIEKPSWNQIFTDTVNTGIYIVSPSVLSAVPLNTPFDFAKDLFPRLMEKEKAIYGYVPDGYWCDIGDTGAYLRCAFDVLDGKVKPDITATVIGRSLWSGSALPDDTAVIPPCYIGSNVTIGENVKLGPYTIINSGAVVGNGAAVERSYIEAANIGDRVEASGAIVCKGAHIGNGTQLREGCVIGEGAVIGSDAIVMNDARVWPDKEIDDGARISGSISAGYNRRGAMFDGAGCVTGQPHIDLTPDFLLRLGSASAAATSKGDIALCHHGGGAARLAAAALETGISAAGRSVTHHDAEFAAAAAFAAGAYNFALTIFVSQTNGNIKLYFYGSNGLPIERTFEQKIEATALRGEVILCEARAVGAVRRVSGITSRYEISAGEAPPWFEDKQRIHVAVRGNNMAERSLYHTLLTTPVYLRSDSCLPQFRLDDEGFRVQAIDETGCKISHERLLAILCMFEASKGNNKLAAPYSSPVFLDYSGEGVIILRPGRDNEARELLANQMYMRDGIFMVSRLCYALMTSGRTLSELNGFLPPFGMSSLEFSVEKNHPAIMRALSVEYGGELVEGLRAKIDRGWVHITPIAGRRVLKVTAEGATEEYAAELCGMIKKKVGQLETGDGVFDNIPQK